MVDLIVGGVEQYGNSNTATVLQDGDDNKSRILQGNLNTLVTASGNNANVSQVS